MRASILIFQFYGAFAIFEREIQSQDSALSGLTVATFEENDRTWRHRRDYSDIENSVGDFLDNLDFFLGKFEIIRNILKDIRYTYFILKQDIILIQEEIQVLKTY